MLFDFFFLKQKFETALAHLRISGGLVKNSLYTNQKAKTFFNDFSKLQLLLVPFVVFVSEQQFFEQITTPHLIWPKTEKRTHELIKLLFRE